MPIQGAAHGRQCCQNRHPANLPPAVQGATGTGCSLCAAHYETDEMQSRTTRREQDDSLQAMLRLNDALLKEGRSGLVDV